MEGGGDEEADLVPYQEPDEEEESTLDNAEGSKAARAQASRRRRRSEDSWNRRKLVREASRWQPGQRAKDKENGGHAQVHQA